MRLVLNLTWEFSDFENHIFNCYAYQINVKYLQVSIEVMRSQALKHAKKTETYKSKFKGKFREVTQWKRFFSW